MTHETLMVAQRREGSALASVAVIIPCHNEHESVLRCLASLSVDPAHVVAFVVVDDGSTDCTAEGVLAAYPEAMVVRGDGNLWWSGAINRGVEAALQSNPDYVLLLNNDCVLSPGDIARLVTVSQNYPRSIVSAAIGDLATGLPVCFGGAFTPLMLDYLTEPQTLTSGSVARVQWLPGHTMFVPAAIFREVGMMDEKNFPQYFGDADFALRAQRSGYELLVDQDLLVMNDRETTGLSANLSLKPARLYSIVTSRRSWLRLDDNIKFWWRYRELFTFRQLLRRYEFINATLTSRALDKLGIRSAVRSIRHRFHPSN